MPSSLYIHSHVQQVIDLHRSVLERRCDYATVYEQLNLFVTNLQKAFEAGNPSVAVEISNFHPDYLGKTAGPIMKNRFELWDFQMVIAREYGYINWQEVEQEARVPFDSAFEESIDLMLQGKLSELEKQLRKRPQLVGQRSAYWHRAGLIHYVSANGVEIWRQIVPQNLCEITQLLLDFGADVNMSSRIYGGGNSLHGLINSSAHPWKAGIQHDLLNLVSNT